MFRTKQYNCVAVIDQNFISVKIGISGIALRRSGRSARFRRRFAYVELQWAR